MPSTTLSPGDEFSMEEPNTTTEHKSPQYPCPEGEIKYEIIPCNLIDAGQRVIQKDGKVSLKDVLEINGIEWKDIVTIYIKKTNLKSQK